MMTEKQTQIYIHVENPPVKSNVVSYFGKTGKSRQGRNKRKKFQTASCFVSNAPVKNTGDTLYDYLNSKDEKAEVKRQKDVVFTRRVQQRNFSRKKRKIKYHPEFNLVGIPRNVVVKREDPNEERNIIEDPTTIMNGNINDPTYYEDTHLLFKDPQEATLYSQENGDSRILNKEKELKKFQRKVKKRLRNELRKKRKEKEILEETTITKGKRKKLLKLGKEIGNTFSLENTKRIQEIMKKREKEMEEKRLILERMKKLKEEEERKKEMEMADQIEVQPKDFAYIQRFQTNTEKTVPRPRHKIPFPSPVPKKNKPPKVHKIRSIENRISTILLRAKNRNIAIPHFCGCLTLKKHCNNCQFYRNMDSYFELLKNYVKCSYDIDVQSLELL